MYLVDSKSADTSLARNPPSATKTVWRFLYTFCMQDYIDATQPQVERSLMEVQPPGKVSLEMKDRYFSQSTDSLKLQNRTVSQDAVLFFCVLSQRRF